MESDEEFEDGQWLKIKDQTGRDDVVMTPEAIDAHMDGLKMKVFILKF